MKHKKVECLFAEARLKNDDIHAGCFCLREAQIKQRKKCHDVRDGAYMIIEVCICGQNS